MLLSHNIYYDLALFVVPVFLFTLWHRRSLKYWKTKGVKYPKPSIIFGNLKDLFFTKKTLGQCLRGFYDEYKAKGERYIGLYAFNRPILMPIDLELIKSIISTDYNHFSSRGMYSNKKVDALSGNLFNLESEEAQGMRTKLTPVFSTGKIKILHNIILDSTKVLIDVLSKESENHPVEVNDILKRYTIDVTASAGFGITVNSLSNPNTPFKIKVMKTFELSIMNLVRLLRQKILPHKVLRSFNATNFPRDVIDFYYNTTKDVVTYREKNNIVRNDFLNILIELKKSCKDKDDSAMINMTGQTFVFVAAGYETTAVTLHFALYELATNIEVQDKARKEIQEVLKKHNNEVTYEAVNEMKYLTQVVQETLRKYSPFQYIWRKCTSTYKIPGDSVIIEKGTYIMIPVSAIHYDPDIYSNPDVFNPDRFSMEEKSKRHNFSFLPFGEGPRMCMGMRFGMHEAKVGIMAILNKFKLSLNKKTDLPIEFEKLALLTAPKGNLVLNMDKISV